MEEDNSSQRFTQPRSSKAYDDDKQQTIPFLSRLIDMLEDDNGHAISFFPAEENHFKLARIVIHNRSIVEQHILPKYFNHSSFASLRRQLNYFSFTRVGRGRRNDPNATYQNPHVFVLSDILKLKRRTVCSSSSLVPLNDEIATRKDYQLVNKRSGFHKKNIKRPTLTVRDNRIKSESGTNASDHGTLTTSTSTETNLPPSVSISSFGEIQIQPLDSTPSQIRNPPDSNMVTEKVCVKHDQPRRIALDLTQPYLDNFSRHLEQWNMTSPNVKNMENLYSFAKEDFLLCSVLLQTKLGRNTAVDN